MALAKRCPACRAKMPDADICGRCGSDFSIAHRAERQAQTLARSAVHALLEGNAHQAGACAMAAIHLAESPLAQAVARTIQRRKSSGNAAKK